MISMTWLANPNHGCSDFPCGFMRSYDYLIYSQIEDSCAY